MTEVPNVTAIAQQIKARIKQIEAQLRQHKTLANELDRLRGALARLDGAARSKVRGKGSSTSVSTPPTDRARAPRSTSTPARAPRGQNKARVLEALKAGPMTASEISGQTGVATATASTLLSRLAKSGEIVKAERGYRLPGQRIADPAHPAAPGRPAATIALREKR